MHKSLRDKFPFGNFYLYLHGKYFILQPTFKVIQFVSFYLDASLAAKRRLVMQAAEKKRKKTNNHKQTTKQANLRREDIKTSISVILLAVKRREGKLKFYTDIRIEYN
jgi:hypothetical protein